jgi:hypothetical protein
MPYGGVRISNIPHDYKGSTNVLNKTCKWFELHDLEMINKFAVHSNVIEMSMLKMSTTMLISGWKRFVNFLRSQQSYNLTIVCKMTV